MDLHLGRIPEVYAHISNCLVEELTAMKIEEISQEVSKDMYDFSKTIMGKPSQYTQGEHNTSDKGLEGSNQIKELD